MKETDSNDWLGWDRTLWGVEFKSEKKESMLIGGAWHRAMAEGRYTGEPSRAVLFTSRSAARKWCQEMNDKYKDHSWPCDQWKFKPVKVRELVIPITKKGEKNESGKTGRTKKNEDGTLLKKNDP